MLNPRKAVAMAIFPIIVHFVAQPRSQGLEKDPGNEVVYCLARAIHDVACDLACAVTMRSSSSCFFQCPASEPEVGRFGHLESPLF